MESTIINIDGMMCQGCVGNITGVIGGLAGVASVQVSLEQKQAAVSYDASVLTRDALCAAIEDAGFDAR